MSWMRTVNSAVIDTVPFPNDAKNGDAVAGRTRRDIEDQTNKRLENHGSAHPDDLSITLHCAIGAGNREPCNKSPGRGICNRERGII
jgi:hypothetical protein